MKMKKIKAPILILILFFILIFSCKYIVNTNNNFNNNMIIHYIDVRQGDCILIQVNNKNLLIDSGPSTSRKELLKYLNKIKVKKFDYIIATHPHEDHIGNMDTIIKRFNVENFYAPKVITTSITFENMISALVDKNLKINILKKESKNINLGKNTSIQIFSPEENISTDNLNNYSPIIKINFLNTSFLFTGDAETTIEQQVLSENPNLKCDILKVGHHGSSTSTSSKFLASANPSIAIISVGKNNTYGHPSLETLNLLDSMNIRTIRTDISGTIVVNSDGKNITISRN